MYCLIVETKMGWCLWRGFAADWQTSSPPLCHSSGLFSFSQRLACLHLQMHTNTNTNTKNFFERRLVAVTRFCKFLLHHCSVTAAACSLFHSVLLASIYKYIQIQIQICTKCKTLDLNVVEGHKFLENMR